MNPMTAKLTLQDVFVSFPIFGMSELSLRATLLNKVGASFGMAGSTPTVDALKNISLSLQSGDRLGVIGHNGAGKSTLLKVFTGVYEPTAGTAIRSGFLASMTDFLLGMDPVLSGYENIMRRGILMGLTPRQVTDIVPDIEEFCELGEYLRLPMKTYSTGMYIRVAFAMATSVQPEILVLDEMINAGDMAFMEKSNARMSALIDNSHIVVIASHDLALLERICNLGLVLEKGEMRFKGAIGEAVAAYRRTVTTGEAS